MKSLFKSILISLTLLVYGIGVDNLLHSALIEAQVNHQQTDQVKSDFAPLYSSLFHLPSYSELVSETSTNFQESEQIYLPQWAIVKSSNSSLGQQSIWRNDLLRFRRIDLSLSVKDIIFPFHTFS